MKVKGRKNDIKHYLQTPEAYMIQYQFLMTNAEKRKQAILHWSWETDTGSQLSLWSLQVVFCLCLTDNVVALMAEKL